MNIALTSLEEVEVVIYCAPKCASKTLTRVFRDLGYKYICVHDAKWFHRLIKQPVPTIFNVIDRASERHPVMIIDAYRFPLERKLSQFLYFNRTNSDFCSSSYSVQATEFERTTLWKSEPPGMDEVMEHYDVSMSFDFARGYGSVQSGNLRFCRLRFCDIDRWEELIQSIIKTDCAIRIPRIVRIEEKADEHVAVSDRFVSQYRPPHAWLDAALTDKKFMAYTTNDERNAYREKWSY